MAELDLRKRIMDAMKLVVGRIAEIAAPHLAQQLDNGERTGREFRLKRAILHSRMVRSKSRGDPDEIQNVQAAIWRSDASDEFYDRFAERFETLFLGPHYELIRKTRDVMATRRSASTLVEIGCGDGQVLAHCVDNLPNIERAIGVDINATIVERNKARYAASRKLSFVCADVSKWIAENAQSDMLLFSYGGVMEYLTADALVEMYQRLAAHGSSMVVLTEPISETHDLKADEESHVHGDENSFSHNYRRLLSRAGYDVSFARELDAGGFRWSQVLAICS